MTDSAYFLFLRFMSLMVKINDVNGLVRRMAIEEREENQKIVGHIKEWTSCIESEIASDICQDFDVVDALNDRELKNLETKVNTYYEWFQVVAQSFVYAPLEAPMFTLKNVLFEIVHSLSAKQRSASWILKTIPDFNFTEEVMKIPDFPSSNRRSVIETVGGEPNVISLSGLYNRNPLMWPLIVHEYGHIIYGVCLEDPEFKEEQGEIGRKATTALNKTDSNTNLDVASCLEEIYADLFAARQYGISYLFAFLFHEYLSLRRENALGWSGDKDALRHPPSYLRLKSILRAVRPETNDEWPEFWNVEKCLYSEIENTEVIAKQYLEGVLNPLVDMYEGARKSFEGTGMNAEEVSSSVIGKLHSILAGGEPIGTRALLAGESFRQALKEGDEWVHQSNSTKQVISAGWRYMILDVMAGFLERPPYLEKRRRRGKSASQESTRQKLDSLKDELLYVGSNILYSLDTSAIVSNYEFARGFSGD